MQFKYDHCIGAVTIILPENKTTISLILHIYRVLCLVTNDDKLHIYIVCKLYVSPWHASITIRPGPNSYSPTSAILYDRNCYDRNCFPTVSITNQPTKPKVPYVAPVNVVTYHKMYHIYSKLLHLQTPMVPVNVTTHHKCINGKSCNA